MLISDLFEITQVAMLGVIAVALVSMYFNQRRTERGVRLQAAGQFIQRWNSPEFIRLSSILFDIERIKRLRSVRDPYEELPRDEFDYVIVMLNFFEEIALAVEYDLADEKLLRRYFAQSVLDVFHTLEPVIHNFRKAKRNPAVFVTYEKLVGRWSFSKSSDE